MCVTESRGRFSRSRKYSRVVLARNGSEQLESVAPCPNPAPGARPHVSQSAPRTGDWLATEGDLSWAGRQNPRLAARLSSVRPATILSFSSAAGPVSLSMILVGDAGHAKLSYHTVQALATTPIPTSACSIPYSRFPPCLPPRSRRPALFGMPPSYDDLMKTVDYRHLDCPPMYTSRSNLFDIVEEDEDVDDDCSTTDVTIADSHPPSESSSRMSCSQATSTSSRSFAAKMKHTCIAAKIMSLFHALRLNCRGRTTRVVSQHAAKDNIDLSNE